MISIENNLPTFNQLVNTEPDNTYAYYDGALYFSLVINNKYYLVNLMGIQEDDDSFWFNELTKEEMKLSKYITTKDLYHYFAFDANKLYLVKFNYEKQEVNYIKFNSKDEQLVTMLPTSKDKINLEYSYFDF